MVFGAALGKVYTESTGSVTAPPPSRPRVFVLGDSTVTGTQYNTGEELGSWLPRFADLVGIRDYWNGGLAGTGYDVALFGTNYKTRVMTDVVPSDADVVIVATPTNDLATRTNAQIAADVSTVVAALQNMPTHPRIIIVGALDSTGTNGTRFTDLDAAIITAISGKAAFVSTVGGPLIGYAGQTLMASTPPWLTTETLPYVIAADNFHPNDAGHVAIAGRMQAMYMALEAAGTNRAPVAGTPSVGTPDPTTGVVTGSLKYTDPDGDALTYTVGQPSSGSVTVNSAGVYTFTPTQGARDAAAQTLGPDTTTFTVTASDGRASTPVSVTVPVLQTSNGKVPPVVTGVVTSNPDPSTGVVTVSVTATDADGDPLTYAVAGGQPASGSVTVDANGTFTFTPNQAARVAAAQASGTSFATFTATVSDDQNVLSATVTVPVSPANPTLASGTATTGATPVGAAVAGTRVYVVNQGAGTVSVIDTTTNTTVKTITVGAYPTAVVASPDQTKVYVTNGWSYTVSVIDTTTNTVTNTIAVGAGPVAVAVSPDGTRLYTTNLSANTVSVVNTGTGTVIATVPVGAYPNGVAVSPDGTRVYVSNQYGQSVSVISTTTATPTVIGTVYLGYVPSSIAVSATRAYVTNQAGNAVTVLNTTTATPTVISTIALGAGTGPTSVALSKDATLAYVANSNDTVSVIDTTSNTVLRSVSVDPTPETGAHTLALNATGTQLFITDTADNTLRSITVGSTTPVVNHAPVAGIPTVGAPNASTGVVTGSLNFTDPDANPLSYTVTPPASGSVTVSSAGVYTYTPTQAARDAAATTTGATTATFTATASDGQASTPVSVTVTIQPTPAVNHAPVAGIPTVGAPNASTGVVTGSLNFTDPDANPLSYTVTPPASGSVTVSSAGVYTYTPTQAARDAAATTTGATTATFTVTASDGQASTPVSVTVTIQPTDPTTQPPSVSGSATTGATPVGAAVAGTRVYVVNQGAGTVSVIDTTTNTTVKTITVGAYPTAVVASPDQTKVYVTNGWSYTVSVIDTTTNTVTNTIAVGAGPVAVAVSPDGTRLYTTNLSANTVSVVNTGTGTVIATVPVGAYPNGVAVSPDGTRVYVSNQYGQSVSVISTTTATPTVIGTVYLGYVPSSIAVSATRAYVTNQAGNAVTVLNTTTATPTVISTIALGAGTGPTSVALSKDATLAYVANSNDTVSVIDTTSNTVLRSVSVDPTPETGAHTLALNATGTQLFITDTADNTLRSITVGSTTPVVNHAPVAGIPTVGAPNASTGVVTGSLNFTDPGANPLSYTVPTQPASGSSP